MANEQHRDWTEDDVKNMVTNPIYAGIGPFPRIVSDDQFVKAASKFISDHGPEEFLRRMLTNLRESLPS